MATSGSWKIRAKLTVFGGTLVHSSLGETGFGSDCVYLAGISEPSANAVVVRVRPGPAGPFLAAWAMAGPTPRVSRIVKVIRVRLMVMFSLLRYCILASVCYTNEESRDEP